MTLVIDTKLQKLIDQQIHSGKYKNARDVVRAGILALVQQEEFGQFQPGELAKLLNEGEQSLRAHGTMDGEQALHARRKNRAKLRAAKK